MIFNESVAQPFRVGFAQVYALFARAGIAEQVVFIGSAKVGLPTNAVVAFALGCDMVNAGREVMFVDRLHPGEEMPHRQVPDRCDDAESLADVRLGPRLEGRPGGELHQDAAA